MADSSCADCRTRAARIAALEGRVAELTRFQRESAFLRAEARTEHNLRVLTGDSAAMSGCFRGRKAQLGCDCLQLRFLEPELVTSRSSANVSGRRLTVAPLHAGSHAGEILVDGAFDAVDLAQDLGRLLTIFGRPPAQDGIRHVFVARQDLQQLGKFLWPIARICLMTSATEGGRTGCPLAEGMVAHSWRAAPALGRGSVRPRHEGRPGR